MAEGCFSKNGTLGSSYIVLYGKLGTGLPVFSIIRVLTNSLLSAMAHPPLQVWST